MVSVLQNEWEKLEVSPRVKTSAYTIITTPPAAERPTLESQLTGSQVGGASLSSHREGGRERKERVSAVTTEDPAKVTKTQ